MSKRYWLPLVAIVLVMLAASATRAQYQGIPNYTGPGAGRNFRNDINQRFSGVMPISPLIVSRPFATLPTAQNGMILFCNDCKRTTPCSGGGGGAFAQGVRGAWSCSNSALEENLSMGGYSLNGLAGLIVNNDTTAEHDISNFSVNGVINVKDPKYGAVGDGTTDDTTAIQAALTACAPGQTVHFPKGCYKTTSGLTIPAGGACRLKGDGFQSNSSYPYASGSWTCANITGSALHMTATSGNGIQFLPSPQGAPLQIADLAIFGPGSGTEKCVVLGDATHTPTFGYISNLMIGNCATGMDFGGEDFTVSGLNLNGDSTGLSIAQSTANQNNFYQTGFQRNAVVGLSATSGYEDNFYGGVSQSNANGMNISGMSSSTIQGFDFEGDSTSGITADNCTQSSFIGNRMSGAAETFSWGCAHSSVINNRFMTAGTVTISANGSGYGLGNTIGGTSQGSFTNNSSGGFNMVTEQFGPYPQTLAESGGGTLTLNLCNGNTFNISFADNTATTLATPSCANVGQPLLLVITNNSGGVLTNVTDTAYPGIVLPAGTNANNKVEVCAGYFQIGNVVQTVCSSTTVNSMDVLGNITIRGAGLLGEGSTAFASLPASCTAGQEIYCSDCKSAADGVTMASTCVGSGTGSIAVCKSSNAWKCGH